MCYTKKMILLQLLFLDPVIFFIILISIILAISLHEYSHAWMAYFLGDSTAKQQGRLTINPFAHLDPIGTIVILISGFGWGRPVPFNPNNLKNRKWGSTLVGLAGPFSNFFMASIVGLIMRFFPNLDPAFKIYFSLFVWINLTLGIFNLMPIPPLDGSHIFLSVAPEKVKIFFIQNSIFLFIGLVLFVYYIGLDFIAKPLFILITGLPLPF